MRRLIWAAMLIFLGMTAGNPFVAHAKDSNVRNFVRAAIRDQEALIALHPALGRLNNAIRQDCASKSQGQQISGTYCQCAAAITMQLWQSGMDPKMVPRLNDYLRDPTEAAAQELLRYQGPELYSPTCSVGAG